MAGAPTDRPGTAAGDSDVSALLASIPDPEKCTPKEFDFRVHVPGRHMDKPEKPKKAESKKRGKPDEEEEGDPRPAAGPQKLPHRLLLSAFSKTVGHRPTGLQPAQAKMFVERFPSEFREMSMQKVVLPCNMDNSLPFVAPDGCLPCPALSTFNALKYLQGNPKAMANADDKAKSQMEKIFTRGVQVEWIESQSFLQWQLHVESSSVQAQVQVQPHIVDTALKYLSFCNSRQAGATSSSKGQGQSDNALDDAFGKLLQGKGYHRLQAAKTLLCATEPAVIADLAKWRKAAHYLHANALAQNYFLSLEEWGALRGKLAVIEKTTYSLQSIVAKQLVKLIQDMEIVSTGDVPKLKRTTMNITLFKELCSSVLNATKYKARLQQQYVGVWDEVGSAEKLFKRLIVSGEAGLREVFQRGVALANGQVQRLDFRETDPTSDLAQVCARLQTATDLLRKKQEEEAAAAAAAAAASAPPAAAVDGAADVSSHAADAPGVAPAPSQGQQSGGQNSGAAEAQAPEAKQIPDQKAPAVSPELAAMQAILQEARIATDDIFCIHDRPWLPGDAVPSGLADLPQGTIFVAPSPSTSRGLSGKAVQVMKGPAFGVLEFFNETCAVIVGLGHDPEQKTAARSRLEQINESFKKAKWEMFPVLQQLRSLSYVEYFLVGYGEAHPASSQSQLPKWLGAGELAVERAARIVTCEKQRGGAAIEQEKGDTGHVVLCRTCSDIQSRYVMAMPRRAKQARRAKQDDDLLGGGDEASAAESGDEASTVSSDADPVSGSETEAEAEREGKKAAAQLAASTTPAKIRPARQGMPASLWLKLLNVMQPSKVVIAGTVTFQAGLLFAILQYNDTVFGLRQCPLVGFCAQEPLTSKAWTKKHVKQWQARHLCLHTIERSLAAYAGSRYANSVSNRRAAVGGGTRVLQKQGTDASLDRGLQAAEPPKVTVTKWIMPHGNHGKDAQLLPQPPAPVGEPDPDSDDPDGDAPSSNASQHSLSKRNTRFMAKHAVKVQMSTEASGHGLFAAKDIPAETELPAKGPWFDSLEKVHEYLAGLHAETAAQMSHRVVRVDLAPKAADGPAAASQGQEPPKPTSLYQVVTNPVGFINHFTALQTVPNCKLVLKAGVPLGERCLVVRASRAIKDGKQWLLNYGPHHQCGERVQRNRKRRPGALGAEAQAEGGEAKKAKADADAATPVVAGS